MYLEGSDQHRGWFHTSLLVSCMLNGVPPLQEPADARLHRRRRRQEDVEVEGQRRRAAEGVVHARRRDPAPVGRRHRLLGRPVDLRRDPEARGRELPPDPQHAAFPAGEHRRLRRGEGRRPAARLAGARPLRARRRARAGGRRAGRLRAQRVSRRRPAAADVLLRGPRRLLPRRAEGPALHVRQGEPCAAFGADGARGDPRPAAEADGAGAVVHRGGGVGDRAPGRPVDLLPHLDRRGARHARRRGADGQVDADPRRARRRAEGAGGAARRGQDRLVAAGGGRRSPSPEADYDALASLGDDSALRADHVGGHRRCAASSSRSRSRRARMPSAIDAGTIAPTSASIRRIPTICGRCVANLAGPGEPRRYA